MAKVLHKDVVFRMSFDRQGSPQVVKLLMQAIFRSAYVDDDITDSEQIESCMEERASMFAEFDSIENAYSWRKAVEQAFRCTRELGVFAIEETPPANEPSPPATDAPATT